MGSQSNEKENHVIIMNNNKPQQQGQRGEQEEVQQQKTTSTTAAAATATSCCSSTTTLSPLQLFMANVLNRCETKNNGMITEVDIACDNAKVSTETLRSSIRTSLLLNSSCSDSSNNGSSRWGDFDSSTSSFSSANMIQPPIHHHHQEPTIPYFRASPRLLNGVPKIHHYMSDDSSPNLPVRRKSVDFKPSAVTAAPLPSPSTRGDHNIYTTAERMPVMRQSL